MEELSEQQSHDTDHDSDPEMTEFKNPLSDDDVDDEEEFVQTTSKSKDKDSILETTYVRHE